MIKTNINISSKSIGDSCCRRRKSSYTGIVATVTEIVNSKSNNTNDKRTVRTRKIRATPATCVKTTTHSHSARHRQEAPTKNGAQQQCQREQCTLATGRGRMWHRHDGGGGEGVGHFRGGGCLG